MVLISSLSNPKIKWLRSLADRRTRDQTGLFLIEGIRIVAEAAQLNAGITELIIAPDLLKSQFAKELVQQQIRSGVPCLEVTGKVFKTIATKDNPQGIAAVVRQHWRSLDGIQPDQGLCWIALDSVQDPGNLGTIIRLSDAVGGAGVIILGDSTDPYHPTALRSSMGAIFSQNIVRTSFQDILNWKCQVGYHLVGTSAHASLNYRRASYERPIIMLMGSERLGLSMHQQEACDLMVKIPMIGRSSSLNLAVATGIIVYEIFHQNSEGSDIWTG